LPSTLRCCGSSTTSSYANCRRTHVITLPHVDIKRTPFSPKDRNIDIYRRFVVAEPFDGCSPLLNLDKLGVQTYFLLVNGPNCSYRQKAYHAMKAGAMGVIIIDDDPHRLEEPYSMFPDGTFLSFLID